VLCPAAVPCCLAVLIGRAVPCCCFALLVSLFDALVSTMHAEHWHVFAYNMIQVRAFRFDNRTIAFPFSNALAIPLTLRSLLCSQGAKLRYGRVALYTRGSDEAAKQWGSLHAVQRHMIDSCQCKAVYEGNEEEYAEWYEYEPEAADGERQLPMVLLAVYMMVCLMLLAVYMMVCLMLLAVYMMVCLMLLAVYLMVCLRLLAVCMIQPALCTGLTGVECRNCSSLEAAMFSSSGSC
jgi:hypothetical protein